MHTTGAMGFVIDIPAHAFVRPCLEVFEELGWELPSCAQIKSACRKAKYFTSIYYTQSRTTVPTTTEASRHIAKIISSSKKLRDLLKKGADDEALHQALGKFETLLKENVYTRREIYFRVLEIQGDYNAIVFRSALKDLRHRRLRHEQREELISALSRIEIPLTIFEEGPSLRDPHLSRMVPELMPVWNKLTERSPLTYDPGRNVHPFAKWANDLLEPIREIQRDNGEIPLSQVTRGMVEKIISTFRSAK